MHLNTELMLDLLDRRLDKDQEVVWGEHLAICADCAQDLRWWQQFRLDLKRSHLKSAPDEDVTKAVRIFQPPSEPAGSTLRCILAAIAFDSFVQPELAGARGSSTGHTRQLIMRAEEFDIHIKVWGGAQHRQILGQLLPRKDQGFIPPAQFHLLRNGERIDSTTTDEMGEFHFVNIPEGDLSLQIDLPNLTVIGALNVQEPS